MKYIDKVIQYVDDIWKQLQTTKSEWANVETYADANRRYILQGFTKRGTLHHKIQACMYIIHNDVRQDYNYYMPRILCAILYHRYKATSVGRFLRVSFPMLQNGDFKIVKNFCSKVFDVELKQGFIKGEN